MVTVLLLTLALMQTAPPPTPAPTKQPARPRPAPTATTTATITVTDGSGAGIGGVLVQAIGPLEREGRTTADGMLRLQGLRAGTYRLRFSRDGFFTFEKEVSWRSGQPAPDVPVTLTAAPPPPPTPPPAAPVTPAPPPARLPEPGQAKTMTLPDYIEAHFINGRDSHKEDLVGCSGVGQALIWQILAPWEGRQHSGADAMLYVIGGEGSIKLDGRDVTLGAGSFAVVPRGASYSLSRRGRNPLIVLAMLAGAPCAA